MLLHYLIQGRKSTDWPTSQSASVTFAPNYSEERAHVRFVCSVNLRHPEGCRGVGLSLSAHYYITQKSSGGLGWSNIRWRFWVYPRYGAIEVIICNLKQPEHFDSRAAVGQLVEA